MFDSKDEAEAFAREKATSFDKNEHARFEPRKITLGEFIVEYAAHRIGAKGGLRYRSVETTVHALKRFADVIGNDRRLASIRKGDVNRLFRHLRDTTKLSPNTVAKILRSIKAAFSAAVEMEYLAANPLLGLKIKSSAGVIRYVNRAEIDAILKVCGKMPGDDAVWWRAFVTTLYTVGLRLGEATHMTWRDIDFEAGEIRVTAKRSTPETLAWEPKTKLSLRSIPAPPETITLLTELQGQAPDGFAYVFLPKQRFDALRAAEEAGTPIEGIVPLRSAQIEFSKIVAAASKSVRSLADRDHKPTVSIHDLRRSAITNWAGHVSAFTTMALAGHSTITTTQRHYAATTVNEREQARRAASAAVRHKTDTKQSEAADAAATSETPNRYGE